MAFDPKEAARRAVLTSVGFGVLAFDRAAAQRRQAQARLDSQLAPVRSRVDERLAPARARVGTLLKEARTEAESATEAARQRLPEPLARVLETTEGKASSPTGKIRAVATKTRTKPAATPNGPVPDEPTPA
jgi:hypothetical protein